MERKALRVADPASAQREKENRVGVYAKIRSQPSAVQYVIAHSCQSGNPEEEEKTIRERHNVEMRIFA